MDPARPEVPRLQRRLAPRHVAMISIGGIIGSGLFVGSSAAIATTGPAVVLSYGLAGLLVLVVMQALAELAASAPGIGSFTDYIRLGLGDIAGCAAGWLYWYFWVVALSVEALAGAAILQPWLGLPVWGIALGLMLLMGGVNMLSTRMFGEAEFWLSAVKVLALLAFIGIGGLYLAWSAAQGRAAFANLYAHGGFAPFGPASILVGVDTVIFALVGAEIVTVAAAESDEPVRAIAQLSATLTLRLSLFFLLSMLVIVSVVPWTAIGAGVSPFSLALARIGVPAVAGVMSLIVLVAVLSCLNAGFYVSSRVLFALAARGDAPDWTVRVNCRGTPWASVLAGLAVSAVVMAGAFAFPGAIYAFLVNASGVVMLIVYLLVVFAQLRRRRLLETTDPAALRLRAWGHPWTGIGAAAAIVAVLALMAARPELSAQLWSGLALTACVALGSVLHRHRAAALRA